MQSKKARPIRAFFKIFFPFAVLMQNGGLANIWTSGLALPRMVLKLKREGEKQKWHLKPWMKESGN